MPFGSLIEGSQYSLGLQFKMANRGMGRCKKVVVGFSGEKIRVSMASIPLWLQISADARTSTTAHHQPIPSKRNQNTAITTEQVKEREGSQWEKVLTHFFNSDEECDY